MHRNVYLAAFAALTLVTGVALAQNVAVVNGKPIPKAREDAWVKELTKQGQADTPELRKQVKDRLVQNEILLQEATKRGVADRPDVKFMLDVQRQNALIQALLREEIDKNPITDAQIKAAYEQQRLKVGPKEYRARHILVEKEDDAKGIIDQLKKGGKFEELAKKSKDTGSAANGGDLDWAAPDSFVKSFSDAMTKLNKGQYTEVPVQTQFGWHVIRLDDTRDTQFPPLEQVAPQIREGLQQQKIQAYVESLKKNAKIQ
jgi:peptidyl-prolyl cis-trans isomerase C